MNTYCGAHPRQELTGAEGVEVRREGEDDTEDIHEEVAGEENLLASVAVAERREGEEPDNDADIEEGLRDFYVRVFRADQVPLHTRIDGTCHV